MAGASLQGYLIPTGSHTNKRGSNENLFSVEAFFICMSDQPVAGAGMDKVNPFGITRDRRSQSIFEKPFDYRESL